MPPSLITFRKLARSSSVVQRLMPISTLKVFVEPPLNVYALAEMRWMYFGSLSPFSAIATEDAASTPTSTLNAATTQTVPRELHH